MKPKKRRRGDDVDKPSRKRKRKVRTEQEIDEMEPQDGVYSAFLLLFYPTPHVSSARKAQLDLQIESILKSKKGMRPKKRKKDAEEDVLDRFADEEVSRLRDAMIQASDEDMASNKERLPATAKLRMLPQVMDVLQKSVSFLLSMAFVTLFLGKDMRSPSLTTIFSMAFDVGLSLCQINHSPP